MIRADGSDFIILTSILQQAWAGAPSQEELRAEYYRQRMWDGVRRLGHSEDLLGEVLVEILEEIEEVAAAP